MSYPRILEILVIEDDTAVREAYRATFETLSEKYPLVVTYAASRDEAKREIDSSKIFNVVILDLNLPITSRESAGEGVALGEQLLEDLALREAYPVPVLLIVSGRLNETSIGPLPDRLRDDFFFGRLVNKGIKQSSEIENGLKQALRYNDVGIHIREEGRQWHPTLSPREDDLLRRSILSNSSRVGVDVRWWSSELGPSVDLPSRNRGPTKVLMGWFLMGEGLGQSIPTFFKFEPAGNASFVRRDVSILAQKLSHVKVFDLIESRQRSLLVTQSATNRGIPVPLGEYLQREDKAIRDGMPALVAEVSDQLGQLGQTTEKSMKVSDAFFPHLDEAAMERACRACDKGKQIDRIVEVYRKVKASTARPFLFHRDCNHGDLNASNIAIDAASSGGPHAYIFDAAGMRGDIALRDLATLEVTVLLFDISWTDEDFGRVCESLYETFSAFDESKTASLGKVAQNVIALIRAIRLLNGTSDEQKAYTLMLFDAALRQLSGLGIQPSPNKVVNPGHACSLAAYIADLLINIAPEFCEEAGS